MYSLFASKFISKYSLEVVLVVMCIEFALICFSSFKFTHFTSMLTFSKKITSF